MFRPRHAYKSSITNRYRGKIKICPFYKSQKSGYLSSSLSCVPSPESPNTLRGPKLKLNGEKIRRIKQNPVLLDELATSPDSSEGCSPGQHSSSIQNLDSINLGSNNVVSHTFQAPPRFVNDLKPCYLTPQTPEPVPPTTSPTGTEDMLKCAICGIKDRLTNICKIYGQNSCLLCTKFFASFLKRPRQWYCAQDGDCLMTFDSRCKACWIKICLQKFNIDEEHRKVGSRYSPKLLSSPNVSLITIDTSLPR